MNHKTALAAAAVLVVLAGVIGYRTGFKKSDAGETNAPAPEASAPTEKTEPIADAPDYSAIFDLGRKEPGTRVYVSGPLGVGFTYNPISDSSEEVKLTETGNKIYVHLASQAPADGQWVEIFDKDPQMTLAAAVAARFLKGLDPKDCFVRQSDSIKLDQRPGYTAAAISYPPPADPEEPGWANSEKCSPPYSESNGISYFLMNENNPDRFVFVSVGQYLLTSDGSTKSEAGYYEINWDRSLQILSK
ncbi:MAG: hypothetical protein UY92_C0004G0075 [Candidatus Magasanikbacteria bacterium GW2011_GWA2_56_11]|uniref:Uncharacterized protein n=1 Tax=Candidatus Magasanikbacteria bacterium GW2011_GWA2_56_11 TaxID=1619044 RepID=A0A0G2BB48_9BACT|nr:MAG: hypothetical protein UY92_C0004G0075 [Candidatus Magasanikbacteria bacterium GW2011_GWA2_56_11]